MAGIVGQKINGTTKPYKIPYGSSPTEASAQTKTVAIPGIVVLEAGLSIRVLFAFRQGYDGTPKLNVNDLGAKDIKLNSTDNAMLGAWSAGEVVDFYYNGTYWLTVQDGTATTEMVNDIKNALKSIGLGIENGILVIDPVTEVSGGN